MNTIRFNTPQVGIGIIVLRKIDGKQYVMLHQRKKPHGKNYWGSGGGHLEPGESLQEAALRELREEAGNQLKLKNIKFLGLINFIDLPPKHYVDISFLADWDKGEPMNNSPKETTAWKWFPLDKLPNPLFPPVKKYLIAMKTNQIFFDSKINY